MTGLPRTVAAILGLAAVVPALASCASRPRAPRDEALRSALDRDFGFRGRKLAIELGQAGNVRLTASASRLMGEHLVLLEGGNRVQAIDRESLMPDWSYTGLPAGLRYAPVNSVDSMLLMSKDELHVVDLRYGHLRGGTAIHFDLSPSAPFGGTAGTAYVPCWGGSLGEKTLHTLNLATGLEGWGYRTPGDVRGGVLVGGVPPRQMVYFATDAGDVYALPAIGADSPAPEAVWSMSARGAVTAGLALDGDDLFVASKSGFLYCLDRITGIVKWASPHELELTEAAVATKGSVYQHRGDGSLWCHDRATGQVRWKAPGAARFVVERDGKAVLAAANGDLWAVDGKGKVVGQSTHGSRLYYYPTNTRDGTLYAVSEDGFLFRLEVGGE